MISLLKNVGRVILVISNEIAFCVLAAWYFFAFDIQWGLTWQAVTWGLPLLAGVVFVLVCLIKFLRSRKRRWGLIGIGISLLALVYTSFVLWSYSEYIVGEPTSGPEETADTEVNRILSTLFTNFFWSPEQYFVVGPDTDANDIDLDFLKEYKTEMIDYYVKKDGSNQRIDEKLDELFRRFTLENSPPKRLTLRSSPQNGYYIDYDGKFSRYFEDDIVWGWHRMRLCRPSVDSFMDVSLPVYDVDTGLVLMYVGSVGGPMEGAGWLCLFKYIDGKLENIFIEQIWIS